MDESANRLWTVFAEAVEIADANARKEYLAQVCGTDQALRREIEELLAADAQAGRFLPSRPSAGAARAANEAAAEALAPRSDWNKEVTREKPGDWIGRYRLIEKLGQGGCGVVYMAEQEVPVRRRVALKIIKLGMDTRQVVARFELERQALALMDHPNIAKVFDAGATESGRPYFVMELVEGIRITAYCKQKRLGMRQRLELFIRVCQAVQHAHQKGVIHRDLKPSNILVAVQDGQPVPKVIDFGIAKATEGRLTGLTLLTAFEQFLGTPAYMSPEQAALTDRDVDTRSDVYSLGVLLYELLTGTTPFDTNALLAAGLDELRRTIREKEPLRPSARLSTDLDSGVSWTKIKPHERRKATQPELPTAPPGRPETREIIKLVRGDLDWIVMKCLEKDRTRRYETANGLANDIQRHLNNEPVIARPPSRLYEFQKTVRRHKVGFAATAAVIVSLVAGIVVSVWQAMQKEAERQLLQKNLVHQYVDNGSQLMQQGDLFGSLLWYAAALNLDQGDARREEPHRIRIASVLRQCPKLLNVLSHGRIIYQVRFSPDGTKVITSGADHTARVWDSKNHRELLVLRHDGEVNNARFNADGLRIITSSADRRARIWDSRDGKLLLTLTHENTVWDACFAPDGRVVATACENNKIQLWDSQTGTSAGPLLAAPWRPELLEFSRDGTILAAQGQDHVSLWDIESGQKRLQANLGDYFGAQTFSHDSQWFLSDQGSEIHVWNLKTFHEANYSPIKAKSGLNSVSFSPDGQSIVAGEIDSSLEIWDAKTGQPRLSQPIQHEGGVGVTGVSPDGRFVATGGAADERLRIWNMRSLQPVAPALNHSSAVEFFDFNPNGHQLLANSCDRGAPRLWDLATSDLLGPSRPKIARAPRVFRPNGKQMLIAEGNTVWITDIATGEKLFPLRHTNDLFFASFSQDGRSVITSCVEAHARSHFKNHLFLWDSATGRRLNMNDMVHPFSVRYVAFSKDSLLTCGWDSTTRLWDARDGRPLGTPMRHSQGIFWADFSPNGASIVTASDDKTARVWDKTTCQPITPPLRHRTRVVGAFWSTDGQRLHTVTEDDYLQVWDLATGEPLTPPRKIRSRENPSDSPSAQTLDEPLPLDRRPVADLVALAQLLDLARVDANGKILPLEVADLRAAWESLRQKYPEQFATTTAEVAAWHRRQAQESREEGNPSATLFHLNRALDVAPTDSPLAIQRDQLQQAMANGSAQIQPKGPPIGPRAPNAGPEQIDLSRHYTTSLQESVNHSPGAWDLSDLPSGLQTFGNVRFDVRGVIYLNGAEARKASLSNPEQVSGIRVERKCSRLHFLHADEWGGQAGNGTLIGKYILHYADGETRELEIVEGQHVANWYVLDFPPRISSVPGGAFPVWGALRQNADTSPYVFLYKSTRENPRPDVELTSIDIVCGISPASIILAGLTVE